MLSYVNHELIRNFSLDRVIQSVTILDTEKIIRQVEVFLIQLEERSGGNKRFKMIVNWRYMSMSVV